MSPAPLSVFDIDGVLADVRHRLHHLNSRPKNWRAFFGEMDRDPLLAAGADLVRERVERGDEVRFLTGRPVYYRTATVQWLTGHGLAVGSLTMRPGRDRRPARLWKGDVMEHWRTEGYSIAGLVDDDPAVVAELRSRGFAVVHATWMHEGPTQQADPNQQALWEAQEAEGRT